MVLWALENAQSGELFVSKIPGYRITDFAEAIGPNCKQPLVGVRPGEKIHEEMITTSDSFSTVDLGEYYAIFPSDGNLAAKFLKNKIQASVVRFGFSWNSDSNPEFLSVKQIRG